LQDNIKIALEEILWDTEFDSYIFFVRYDPKKFTPEFWI